MSKIYIHKINVAELISCLQQLKEKEIEYVDMSVTKLSDTQDLLDIYVSASPKPKKFDINIINDII
jgi:hypothetical protein